MLCFFLGAFTKFPKVTISFVMSVRPHETTRIPLNGFSRSLILDYFQKSVEKIQVSLKSDKNNGCFTCRQIYIYIYIYIYICNHFSLSFSQNEREMLQTEL